MIVQFLVALHQPEHALAQHVDELVLDALGITRIGKSPRHRIDQSQAMLELPEQQHATIARHITAIEARFDSAAKSI